MDSAHPAATLPSRGLRPSPLRHVFDSCRHLVLGICWLREEEGMRVEQNGIAPSNGVVRRLGAVGGAALVQVQEDAHLRLREKRVERAARPDSVLRAGGRRVREE